MWLISNSIQQFTIFTAKVEFSDLSSGARLAISGEDGAASFCKGTTDIRQRLNVPSCYCLRERNTSSRRQAKQLLRRARARDPSPAASVSSAVYFKTCCPLALTELLSGCRNLPAPVSCDAALSSITGAPPLRRGLNVASLRRYSTAELVFDLERPRRSLEVLDTANGPKEYEKYLQSDPEFRLVGNSL